MAHPTRRSSPTRRQVLSWAALGGVGAVGSSLVSGCSSSGTAQLTLLENKPEVIQYFQQSIVRPFNRQYRGDIQVTQNSSTTPLTPQFVRGDPPDLACYNFQLEAANFLQRGALSDLSDVYDLAGLKLKAAGKTPGSEHLLTKQVKPTMQSLVDKFATWKDQTCAMPFSVAAASVLYRPDLFEKHDVSVPTTWTELIAACEKFKAAGVTPIYFTDMDLWTLQQGVFDYCIGGTVDIRDPHTSDPVGDYFTELRRHGGDVTKDSDWSFSKNFADGCSKMLQLYRYRNTLAPSLGYNIGNSQFFNGKGAAMYLQGPWALLPLGQANPLGKQMKTFALPCTDDPARTRVRVNLDLAMWIPNDSGQQDAARTMLAWLMQPSVMDAYNKQALATGVRTDSPEQSDPRVSGIAPYVTKGKTYQGATTFISTTISGGNWLQAMLLDGRDNSSNINQFLNKLDSAWANRARRAAS